MATEASKRQKVEEKPQMSVEQVIASIRDRIRSNLHAPKNGPRMPSSMFVENLDSRQETDRAAEETQSKQKIHTATPDAEAQPRDEQKSTSLRSVDSAAGNESSTERGSRVRKNLLILDDNYRISQEGAQYRGSAYGSEGGSAPEKGAGGAPRTATSAAVDPRKKAKLSGFPRHLVQTSAGILNPSKPGERRVFKSLKQQREAAAKQKLQGQSANAGVQRAQTTRSTTPSRNTTSQAMGDNSNKKNQQGANGHPQVVSQKTFSDTASAFGDLKRAAMNAVAQKAARDMAASEKALQQVGGYNLEELVRDMLSPMLQKWLDAHLPNVVNEIVTQQVEQIVKTQFDS